MGEFAIVIERVVKRFEDVIAVNDVSLKVVRGELFGLLGPNGAGKTTTVNILCGLLKPTSGFVSVGGYGVQRENAKVKRLIGVCPQENAVYPYLTGAENVELFGNLYSLDKDTFKSRRDMLLERLGLTQDARRKVEKYSGGMKRRLSIVLALIHNPQIIFLDEPTIGMDPQSRRAVWDFMEELKKEGKTVFMTTHYMEEAEALCDHVGIIDYGKLIALDTPKNLISKNGVDNLEEVFIKLTGRRIREEI
ncbi:MAG: ATP-binding cassette domain-containing protein [Candidatus Bathyarchaeota archaeon]|jgi:ABC-2 type transport system ATP-binding protein|nr:ATP-binding cassette domain-containing protein [Candidatus Bathyarchaeota archaeon A05DMB-3]MDH7606556.1 ATP-binding cassette domain-containing protein [Candidatus Bathyarchaeota archaeon]